MKQKSPKRIYCPRIRPHWILWWIVWLQLGFIVGIATRTTNVNVIIKKIESCE